MQYPSDWTKNETMDGDVFVKFVSQQTERGFKIAEVRIGITNTFSANLTRILNNDISSYKGWSNFQLVDSNTTSSQPAYEFVFTHTPDNGIDYKI
jgi:hypothetical protein